MLSLAMSVTAMTSLVFAEDTTEQTGAEYFPGWSLSQAKYVDFTRVYNTSRNSWEAKMTSKGTGASWNALQYRVPQALLTQGHTYTIKMYVRTEGFTGNNWLAHVYAGIDEVGHFVNNLKNGHTNEKKGVNLYGSPYFTIGLTQAAAGNLFIDDVQIIEPLPS